MKKKKKKTERKRERDMNSVGHFTNRNTALYTILMLWCFLRSSDQSFSTTDEDRDEIKNSKSDIPTFYLLDTIHNSRIHLDQKFSLCTTL